MAEHASCTMFVEINSQRFPMELGHLYLLGKQLSTAEDGGSKKCINLDKEDVEHRHCVLEVGVSDDVYIFDLFSTKGTYLNNERLKSLEKYQLKNGDIVKVGMQQQIKFHHEEGDMSHDSSGFLESNKNTSDIIVSSPESTSQREIRLKRLNNNNKFLVPAIPRQKIATPNTSLVVPETEANTSEFSLNVSSNSRRSDSFTIPETQYCNPRRSTNASDLSIAESNPDVSKKIDINFGNLDDDDDDEFCIPETQEAITCSQRPRLLSDANIPKEKSILEEKTADFEGDKRDKDELFDGSQFRICTQEYNEGFGEEEERDCLTSQIIPIISHKTVLLNNTHISTIESPINKSKSTVAEKDEAETTYMSAIKSFDTNMDEDAVNTRANCTTPDIEFDNEATDQNKQTKLDNINNINFESDPSVLEDEEDLMATQLFPSTNEKLATVVQKKVLNAKELPCLDKENDEVLTLSDKENKRPIDLEPITDLPPTQLFAINEASSARSSSSTSSRSSINLNPSTSKAAQNNNLDHDEEDDLLTQAFIQPSNPPLATKTLKPAKCFFNSTLLDDKNISKNPASFFAEMEKKSAAPLLRSENSDKDSENEELKEINKSVNKNDKGNKVKEQQISKTDTLKTSTTLANKEYNLMDEETDEEDDAVINTEKELLSKVITKNPQLIKEHIQVNKNVDDVIKSPSSLLPQMERTPNQKSMSPPKPFKMPEKEFSLLRKTSSLTSTESDMDLLMCTPQLIKEHIPVTKNDATKRSLLAAKNVSLFGDETDDDDGDDNSKHKEKELLVQLINVPKDSKDFDRLLPHLKKGNETHPKRKSTITEEQMAAKEAYKDYKFNISFGQEQEKNKSKTLEKSSTLSRDERHVARDKERELAKLKKAEEKLSKKAKNTKANSSKNEIEPENTKKTERSNKKKSEMEQVEPPKQERRGRKRLQESDKIQPTKEDETKKITQVETERATRIKQEAEETEKVEQDPSKLDKRSRKRLQSSDKTQPTKENDNKKAKESKKETAHNETKSVKNENKIPARRMTRLKSRLEDKPPSVKEDLIKNNMETNEDTDDLDSIPTQPLIRSTRNRSSSKQSESQDSIASNTSSRKITAGQKANSTSKNTSSKSSNTSLNGSAIKIANERKRKADPPTQQVAAKERKRLRSTNSQDLSTTHSTSSSSSGGVRLISTTMVEPNVFQELSKHSAGLWSVAANPADSEVLVMDKSYRTFKFLLAMARGIPIVNSNWLKKINQSKSSKNVAINDYLFTDAVFEKKHKFSLIKSLKQANQKPRLFEEYEFLMTSGILPNPSEIKALIETAGGCVHLKVPPPARDGQKIYLISSVNDKREWHKFRRLNKNIIIISTEAIMSAVMRQNCSPLSNSNNLLA